VKSLMFSKVAAGLGLDRAKQLFTGAAPIGQDTLRYFGALQLPVMELYGMSECTGPQTLSLVNYFKAGACGVSLPGTEIKIDHVAGRDREGEGEICFRGRHIMLGYMHNEAKTRETIDDLGFLHSGDVGRVGSDGLLYITGRIKELIITAGGENIAPVPIEDIVKTNCPALSCVMMVGDQRKYNVCLVTLKTTPTADGGFTNQLTNEALAVSPGVTTVEEACACPVWTEYITAGIKATNAVAVSNAQKIQKFKVLPVDFSVAGNELTPTLKLKRSTVSTKYASEIEKLYA
jgi:long-chain-fatty-acid--CoA ligase ACSBG